MRTRLEQADDDIRYWDGELSAQAERVAAIAGPLGLPADVGEDDLRHLGPTSGGLAPPPGWATPPPRTAASRPAPGSSRSPATPPPPRRNASPPSVANGTSASDPTARTPVAGRRAPGRDSRRDVLAAGPAAPGAPRTRRRAEPSPLDARPPGRGHLVAGPSGAGTGATRSTTRGGPGSVRSSRASACLSHRLSRNRGMGECLLTTDPALAVTVPVARRRRGADPGARRGPAARTSPPPRPRCSASAPGVGAIATSNGWRIRPVRRRWWARWHTACSSCC